MQLVELNCKCTICDSLNLRNQNGMATIYTLTQLRLCQLMYRYDQFIHKNTEHNQVGASYMKMLEILYAYS